MNKLRKIYRRFKFAWGYAYETEKWKSFKANGLAKDPLDAPANTKDKEIS